MFLRVCGLGEYYGTEIGNGLLICMGEINVNLGLGQFSKML